MTTTRPPWPASNLVCPSCGVPANSLSNSSGMCNSCIHKQFKTLVGQRIAAANARPPSGPVNSPFVITAESYISGVKMSNGDGDEIRIADSPTPNSLRLFIVRGGRVQDPALTLTHAEVEDLCDKMRSVIISRKLGL